MTHTPGLVEYLDVYDEVENHTGNFPRDEVHKRGLWHRVFHCLIVTERNGVPTAVLQQRSELKAAFPGLLDISSAGHLAAGETPLDGLRELEEELGVRVEPTELYELGVRRLVDNNGEGRLNRELAHVFLLRDDRPLDQYSVGSDEVDAVYDVPIHRVLELLHGHLDELVIDGVAGAGSQTSEPIKRPITKDDLVPSDGYWTVMLVMAERFLAGNRAIAI